MSSFSPKLFKLNNGNLFPLVGFGTYLIKGLPDITRVLDEALKVGYRSFDTAAFYENEKEIGIALKQLLPKYNLSRNDIYLTSKLWTDDHGGGARTQNAVRKSIDYLQCGYLDLYLIHYPGDENLDPSDPRNSILRKNSWSTLEELYKDGLLKSIGVSNYSVKHIRELMNNSAIKPVVNQVEWHPHHHPQALLDECRSHGILLQAFSSLGGSNTKAVLNDPIIQEISKQINKPIGPVLLKWAVQQNIAVIPKAASVKHIRENFQLDFTIPDDLMEKLSNLPTCAKYDWNSEDVY